MSRSENLAAESPDASVRHRHATARIDRTMRDLEDRASEVMRLVDAAGALYGKALPYVIADAFDLHRKAVAEHADALRLAGAIWIDEAAHRGAELDRERAHVLRLADEATIECDGWTDLSHAVRHHYHRIGRKVPDAIASLLRAEPAEEGPY